MVEFEPLKVNFKNFGTILDADMQVDLKTYFKQSSSKIFMPHSVGDLVRHNSEDSLIRFPYAQERLDGVLASSLSADSLAFFKESLQKEGRSFFETPMTESNLDFILSINNWNAGHAAEAQYPCLRISMGFSEKATPRDLPSLRVLLKKKNC